MWLRIKKKADASGRQGQDVGEPLGVIHFEL